MGQTLRLWSLLDCEYGLKSGHFNNIYAVDRPSSNPRCSALVRHGTAATISPLVRLLVVPTLCRCALPARTST